MSGDVKPSMKCPICDKPVRWKDNPHRPFCSERCSTIDLGNWASENYRVAAPLQDIDDSGEQTPGDSINRD
ncbi:MAG TPA: DNA gyrase inhibitor YacG [Blastocatellia bacterium]|nr:DNA gyrase inhibitor YacG [Blastocatellia bacterium]